MIDEQTTTEVRKTNTSAQFDMAAWMRAEVTLTVQRWTLITAGLAALVLLFVALD